MIESRYVTDIYVFLDIETIQKYIVIAPWAVHSTYRFVTDDPEKRDLGYFLVFPFLLFRILHNQVWISLSRYYTSSGKRRIVDKGIDFNQVDRETNWCAFLNF